VRRRWKTHTLRGVPAQATPPAALTPGASSAGNATVGAPPDGDDTGAAIPARRGAALSTAARMGTPAPGHAAGGGMTGAAAQRSPHGFAQGRTECAYAPRSRITCGRFGRARARRCAAVESSADHGRRVCQLRLPGDCARSGRAVAIDEQVLKNAERLAEMAGREALVAARQMPLEAFQPLTGDGNDIIWTPTPRREPADRGGRAGRKRQGRGRAVPYDGGSFLVRRARRDARLQAVPGAAASAACYGR
jgi:hypothetical protein